MEATAGMVAGSHKRNVLVRICHDSSDSGASNIVPVLCVARNVACNTRGGFFKILGADYDKEFDDGLLQKIPQIAYEGDIKDIPPTPNVSNYLISEDDGSASNGNRDPFLFGVADSEVERKLKDAISAASAIPMTTANLDPGSLLFNSRWYLLVQFHSYSTSIYDKHYFYGLCLKCSRYTCSILF